MSIVTELKYIKKYITWILGALLALYVCVAVLLNVPAFQTFIAARVASALAEKLGTRVSISRVDLGILNRVIIDDVNIFDQRHKPLLNASRMSAKLSLSDLLSGKITVTSAQLFGIKLNAYREDSKSPFNFQFVLDSLASKNPNSKSNLNLAVHSLVIRHGLLAYNQLDKPYGFDSQHHRVFTPNHLLISGLSGYASLKHLTNDSINFDLRSLALHEQSGLTLSNLAFSFVANRKQALLSNFKLELPHSLLDIPVCMATYSFNGKHLYMASLFYQFQLAPSHITAADLACFIPWLASNQTRIDINARLRGSSTSLRINPLSIAASNGAFTAKVSGSVANWTVKPRWYFALQQFDVRPGMLTALAGPKLANVLKQVNNRVGNFYVKGAVGGLGSNFAAITRLLTQAGSAQLSLGRYNRKCTAHIVTQGLNLARITGNHDFGQVAARIDADCYLAENLKQMPRSVQLKGTISRLDYKQYAYKNIHVDGSMRDRQVSGLLSMTDPNIDFDVKGRASLDAAKMIDATAHIRHLNLNTLHVNILPRIKAVSGTVTAHLKGNSLSNAAGTLAATQLDLTHANGIYHINSINAQLNKLHGNQQLSLNSDLCAVDLNGQFDFGTLTHAVTNVVGAHLPTLPGLPKYNYTRSHYTALLKLYKTDWLNTLLGIPFSSPDTLQVSAYVNDVNRQIALHSNLPQFSYNGNDYSDVNIDVSTTPDDSLRLRLSGLRLSTAAKPTLMHISAAAAHNRLNTSLYINNQAKQLFLTKLNTEAEFYKDENGKSTAHVWIRPSDIQVGDSVWKVHPSDLYYSKQYLSVNHFAISHNNQHVIVNGTNTVNNDDSLLVDLKGVDVNYILNLVNFHSVDFSGLITGKAHLQGLFGRFHCNSELTVNDFKFEGGRMGVLLANVSIDPTYHVQINARANDITGVTLINGYVSPKRNYIDLGITAMGTRLEFLQDLCSGFADNIDGTAHGAVRVAGALNNINLEGQLVANGSLRLPSTGVTYYMKNDTITAIPNEIQFRGDTITDKYGHAGLLTGALHHKHLTHLTADISVQAANLLAFDTHQQDGSSFFGTVFASGKCSVVNRPGRTVITADVTPQRGSFIEYNTSTPDEVGNNAMIHWGNADSIAKVRPDTPPADAPDIPSDLYINLLIHATPMAALKVLTDANTGDLITLHGNGVIKANYFNKNGMGIFGNYTVEDGDYKLTIQNVIKRTFTFEPGGTIMFSGDAYDAALKLRADYMVNGVSLSDLQLGSSFSNNNVRVNCLMDITGTPREPKVDFNMDFPTLGTDAKQMIYSLLNSEDEMNQQALCLLALGRFMGQNTNNAATGGTTTQQSETSLAMQSIISGQLSQQLSNMLTTFTGSSNWNIGANISTGNEGWNNAEYEGLLSGRMLNNRLLFNGQFGYRDNASKNTTSFIGDFDLRYLITPNGNWAVRVYNQTNDRYFTRNSLTTQGVGLIIKHDFNKWGDLFRWRHKKSRHTK